MGPLYAELLMKNYFALTISLCFFFPLVPRNLPTFCRSVTV